MNFIHTEDENLLLPVSSSGAANYHKWNSAKNFYFNKDYSCKGGVIK